MLAKIGCEDRLWDKLTNQFYLGSEDWLKKMRAQVETKPRSTDDPRTQRAAGRPQMNHRQCRSEGRGRDGRVDSNDARPMFYEIL